MTKYTSIDTVLYELSTEVDESIYNETLFKEWAIKALRKFKLNAKYDVATCFVPVMEHKALLPSSAVQLVQIAYRTNFSGVDDLEELRRVMGIEGTFLDYLQDPDSLVYRALYASVRSNTGWNSLKLTTNNFHVSLLNDTTIYNNTEYLPALYDCPNCEHEYSVDSNGCIVTTVRTGVLYIAFKHYTIDLNGNTLIPDNEDLKDAIRHYVLYRHWSRKSLTNESKYEREFHLKQFEVLKAKATADINYPDEAQMENIKNQLQRLVPRSNMRDGFFSKLSNKELTSYE